MAVNNNFEAIRKELSNISGLPGPVEVAQTLRRLGLVVSDAAVQEILDQLRTESLGLGPLEPLIAQDGVTDVIVNGPNSIYIDAGSGLQRLEPIFVNDDQVRRIAVRLAAGAGRRLDDSLPFVDARLADGTRLHAMLGCLTDTGTCISLRVPARVSMTLGDWVDRDSLTVRGANVIGALIDRKAAFLVSGGTGSGKTTLLATLLGEVDPEHRILIVEDSRELAPNHPHTVRLEARPANAEGVGAITLTDLVRQALRMRPDRLVVGEVRGAEICDLLMALNTGHEGGCGTVHANSSTDVPARIEALAALGGMSLAAVQAQMAAALDFCIHIRRLGDGRRFVEQISLLFADETSGRVTSQLALGWTPDGRTELGPGYSRLEAWL